MLKAGQRGSGTWLILSNGKAGCQWRGDSLDPGRL